MKLFMPMLFGIDDAVIIGGLIVVGIVVIGASYVYKRASQGLNPAAQKPKPKPPAGGSGG